MMTQRKIADIIHNREHEESSKFYNINAVIICISAINTVETIRASFEDVYEYQTWVNNRLAQLRQAGANKFYVIKNGTREYTSDEFFKWFNSLSED